MIKSILAFVYLNALIHIFQGKLGKFSKCFNLNILFCAGERFFINRISVIASCFAQVISKSPPVGIRKTGFEKGCVLSKQSEDLAE